jgi:alkaline phosphatase D
MGRTRTAPLGPVAGLRFAAASCSSIYSGWFNAYRRIAERDDLDLMIHVGDYIYDFVDEEEQIRVPAIFPTEPASLEEWRALHAYYLADPDLRMARAVHPWMLLWDNHDLDRVTGPSFAGSVQAFREWNPIPDTDPARPEIAYRRLRFGDLADVIMMDVLLHRDIDLVPGTQEPSILGTEQFAWLAAELEASPTAWRILGSQKVLGTVRVNPDLMEAFIGERREIFDPGTWDGYPAARTQLFDLLADEDIDDNLVISGDSHVSAVMDLVDHPQTPGNPPVGVEILPTSISRGNFDETLKGLGLTPGVIASVLPGLVADTLPRNPHHLYLELSLHGYGVLDVTPARIVAEIWYSDILARSDEETLGASFTVERGANHWTR